MKKLILSFGGLLFAIQASARITVVTTVADLEAITREVGGDEVQVETIAKGSQDPHAIEAKPSYMTKMSRADLVISIGLGLEGGWLPPLKQGARNPKLMSPTGSLEVGPLVNPIEIPKGPVSRAEGDVHPEGNPHVTLDPERAGRVAALVATRLGDLDAEHRSLFTDRANKLAERLKKKTIDWKARVGKTGIRSVVTYHRALNYFLVAFAIENPIVLEPKPGIPPTSGHLLEVIRVMKEKKINLILVENFFDSRAAERIKTEIPGIRIVSVPVAVGGHAGVNSIDDLYERLVQTIEGRVQ